MQEVHSKLPVREPRDFLIVNIEQAGAELGQAQLKLGLDSTLIFFRFDFSGFSLIEFVWYTFDFVDLAWKLGLANWVQ